jgi:hypothetical protein
MALYVQLLVSTKVFALDSPLTIAINTKGSIITSQLCLNSSHSCCKLAGNNSCWRQSAGVTCFPSLLPHLWLLVWVPFCPPTPAAWLPRIESYPAIGLAGKDIQICSTQTLRTVSTDIHFFGVVFLWWKPIWHIIVLLFQCRIR